MATRSVLWKRYKEKIPKDQHIAYNKASIKILRELLGEDEEPTPIIEKNNSKIIEDKKIIRGGSLINPTTNRIIKRNGRTHRRLVLSGVLSEDTI